MIREIWTGNGESVIEAESTKGLGRLSFCHPVGTFSLTPASNILIDAIINNQSLLQGTGIDWGSGVGCLAILAAKINTVNKVYGLEIAKENVEAAQKNVKENKVDGKVCFMLADSYSPFNAEEKQQLDSLKGRVDFILSNPPSSDWDDGFGFRRIVMNGAKEFLKKDGLILLNISFQYGATRVESLYKDSDGFTYKGLAASTDWVPFDLNRPDLLECLNVYAGEEANGGAEYTFSEDGRSDKLINAQTALKNYNRSGVCPFTKWQTHMFQYGK